MTDEQQVVRNVSWREVFGFTHIFKSWKMAIHPSKIVLALLAIALTFVLGRCVLDRLWGAVSDHNRVIPSEAWGLWISPTRADFQQQKDQWVRQARPRGLAALLERLDSQLDGEKLVKEDFDDALDQADDLVRRALRKKVADARTTREDAVKAAKDKTGQERKDALDAAENTYADAHRAAVAAAIADQATLEAVAGGGIFQALVRWEDACLQNALRAVWNRQFLGGLEALRQTRGRPGPWVGADAGFTHAPPTLAAPDEPMGLLAWLVLAAWGVWWVCCAYPVYFIVLGVLTLAIWSVLGGAICRIAALHSARDEKISIPSAVRFSLGKVMSFLTAPLLPVAGIVAFAFPLVLGGLLGLIPYAGEWFVALCFAVALVFGALIAFLVVGLGAGVPLMWPTIAVEGSDSFDAISRSFSYIYARPFRYGLYWLVAAVYGTVCVLFVRLFAFIALACTHRWVGWAMGWWGGERSWYARGAGKLDVMWSAPTFWDFPGPWQRAAMDGSEAGAARLLGFWVCVVSAIVLAFAVNFLFAAATNIYFLMRRKVDATDLDDVYIEESEEETVATAPPAEMPATAPEAPAPPSAERPAEEPPAP